MSPTHHWDRLALVNAGAMGPQIEKMIRLAVSLAGSYADESRYYDRIYETDREAWRKRAAQDLSSCGIFYERLCREAGVSAKWLYGPYEKRMGRAIIDSVAHAKQHGAYTDLSGRAFDRESDMGPKAGDAVILGWNGKLAWSIGEPAIQHLSFMVSHDLAIDGGQAGRKDANYSIQYRRRRYVVEHGQLWGMAEGGELTGSKHRPVSKGRRVVGIIRTTDLPFLA